MKAEVTEKEETKEMKKLIIAGLVAFSLVALAGSASAYWNVDIEAEVNNATAIIYGAGGSDECGDCLEGGECPPGCSSTVSYYLQSNAGIVAGDGDIYIDGFGGAGFGAMFTEVDGGGYQVFADQTLDAVICQDCCEPFEHYHAESSVDIHKGGAYIELAQATEVTGPYTGYYPTTGQILYVNGGADEGFDVHLTATEGGETHTMGIYGENMEYFGAEAFQGFEYDDSTMYGWFGEAESCWGLMWYGDLGEWD